MLEKDYFNQKIIFETSMAKQQRTKGHLENRNNKRKRKKEIKNTWRQKWKACSTLFLFPFSPPSHIILFVLFLGDFFNTFQAIPEICYAFHKKYLYRSRFSYFSILLQKQLVLVHYLKLAFSSHFRFFICSNSIPNVKTLISLEKQIVCFNRRRRWFCNEGINWIKDKVCIFLVYIKKVPQKYEHFR